MNTVIRQDNKNQNRNVALSTNKRNYMDGIE